jgi:hypothetical protein
VGVKVRGIGGDRAAVAGLGRGDLVRGLCQGVLGEAKIVQEMGVVGLLFNEGSEQFLGGCEVLFFEGLVGLGKERILFLEWVLGCVGGAGGELGVGRADQDQPEKY